MTETRATMRGVPGDSARKRGLRLILVPTLTIGVLFGFATGILLGNTDILPWWFGLFLFGVTFGGLFRFRKRLPSMVYGYFKGARGEEMVAGELARLPATWTIFNGLILPDGSDADHVAVGPQGIFVIETKNYKGWIFGHENSEEWKQSLLGKRRWYGWSSEQHKFRNPIRQNLSHTRAIKKLLSEIGDFRIIPIVVFSDRADLKITTPNHIVINWRNLRNAIRQFNVPCIPEEFIKKITDLIISANIMGEDIRKAHTFSVQQTQLHKHQLIENGICPQCKSPLVERKGRYGEFLGCTNYPKCRFTHKI
jgi:hypothetical protein